MLLLLHGHALSQTAHTGVTGAANWPRAGSLSEDAICLPLPLSLPDRHSLASASCASPGSLRPLRDKMRMHVSLLARRKTCSPDEHPPLKITSLLCIHVM